MINCSLCCVISAALLGSMVYMFFNCNKNNKIMYFMSLLDSKQQEIYKNISQERLNIYLQGWVLGLIIGLIYLNYYAINKTPTYCIFIALVLGTTYIHYNLMPKSTYMLEHINNGEQAKAWLGIYKEMKFRCQMGMILGVVSLPFICNIFV
tara:strand:- start:495 stop:947 length:453 start_codon:yes stop_codon:yes gene_type:complete